MTSDLLDSGGLLSFPVRNRPPQGCRTVWIEAASPTTPAFPDSRDASIPHGGPAPDRASVAPRDEAGADKEYVITWLYCV
ncbi:MAG: hypothetical protein IID30_09130 [Planctomycetes bacterium]|nr:hypothetical protein [Planctomycetota bacterium]